MDYIYCTFTQSEARATQQALDYFSGFLMEELDDEGGSDTKEMLAAILMASVALEYAFDDDADLSCDSSIESNGSDDLFTVEIKNDDEVTRVDASYVFERMTDMLREDGVNSEEFSDFYDELAHNIKVNGGK